MRRIRNPFHRTYRKHHAPSKFGKNSIEYYLFLQFYWGFIEHIQHAHSNKTEVHTHQLFVDSPKANHVLRTENVLPGILKERR